MNLFSAPCYLDAPPPSTLLQICRGCINPTNAPNGLCLECSDAINTCMSQGLIAEQFDIYGDIDDFLRLTWADVKRQPLSYWVKAALGVAATVTLFSFIALL